MSERKRRKPRTTKGWRRLREAEEAGKKWPGDRNPHILPVMRGRRARFVPPKPKDGES